MVTPGQSLTWGGLLPDKALDEAGYDDDDDDDDYDDDDDADDDHE